jgi:hypothetical protein
MAGLANAPTVSDAGGRESITVKERHPQCS